MRTAKRLYKALAKIEDKANRLAIAADFEVLAECVELSRNLAVDAALQAVCGPHFSGHNTPFKRLIAINGYALRVKHTHGLTDRVDLHLRHMLLQGPSERLARVAKLAEDPDTALAADTLAAIADDQSDLEDLQRSLVTRAERALELGQRAASLGLKPDVRAGAVVSVVEAALKRLGAEAQLEANVKVRELLQDRWRGAMTERGLLLDVVRAASEVERARLPAPMRSHLYNVDRDARIARLAALTGPLVEAVKAVVDRWSQVDRAGKIDETAFLGMPFAEARSWSLIARFDRALEAADQLVGWTDWLVARRDCVESGLEGILVSCV